MARQPVLDTTESSAKLYEDVLVPLIPAPLAHELVDDAALRTGERVVDVGCGTGAVTLLAAERVGPGGSVVGVDPSVEMLNVACSLPNPSGAAILWLEAPAEALPVETDTKDVVLCQLALMFVADPRAALEEMHRVLTKGGRVAINVLGTMPRPFTVMLQALGDAIDPALESFLRKVFSMDDLGSLAALLDEAGFGGIEVSSKPRTFNLGPPDEFLWGYLNGTPLSGAVASAPPARLERLEAEVLAGWTEFIDDGDLVADIPIIEATGRAR